MRVDFEIGALKFCYIDTAGTIETSRPLELFKEMVQEIGKVLPAEVLTTLVAADPAVIEAMRKCELLKWSKKFDEEMKAITAQSEAEAA